MKKSEYKKINDESLKKSEYKKIGDEESQIINYIRIDQEKKRKKYSKLINAKYEKNAPWTIGEYVYINDLNDDPEDPLNDTRPLNKTKDIKTPNDEEAASLLFIGGDKFIEFYKENTNLPEDIIMKMERR